MTDPFERGPLDLRLLEIFCLVCEQKSFSKAAERLRLSQPTVSSHIKTQAVVTGIGLAVLSHLSIRQEITSGLLKVLGMPDLDPLERPFFQVTHARRIRSPLCNAFLQWLDTLKKSI